MNIKIKNIYQRGKLLFIMCVITFLIGCFFVYVSRFDNIDVKLKIALIAFIPFVIFLIFDIINYYNYNKIGIKIIVNICTGYFMAGLLIYYFIALFLCAIMEFESPITDIKKYSSMVKGTELTKVFPKKIPDNASNVHFTYQPGLLQGGTSLSLYYIDDSLNLEAFDLKYKDKALWIGHIKDYDGEKGLLTNVFFNTPINDENDFIIYLVKGRCDNSGYCNHGEYLFGAFNEKTNEVVYVDNSW